MFCGIFTGGWFIYFSIFWKQKIPEKKTHEGAKMKYKTKKYISSHWEQIQRIF